MNEHAKQKLADFLDKEVADKEIVIADLIYKVYDFAVSVERERCLNFVDFGISRSVTPTEYLQAMEIVYRAMIYDGSDYDEDELKKQIDTEKQCLIEHYHKTKK